MTVRVGSIDEGVERARRVVDDVPDPELVAVTLGDLGVVRHVGVVEGDVMVVITPTYIGCPALVEIQGAIVDAVERAGFERCVVTVDLGSAWTTDRISERGRERLLAAGIAPPASTSPSETRVEVAPGCPRCGSRRTRSATRFPVGFGSTLCKSAWRCEACAESFEYFKPV